jgi:SAM-dependent methyltransferase
MKDNFSKQSELYKQFRPTYPPELFKLIYQYVKDFNFAWDCATGNGQIAKELSKKFKRVCATDISRKQVIIAERKENIFYSIEKAEQTSFNNEMFDLITVGQAAHWFNFDDFYKEVNRILKTGGVIALTSYHLLRSDDKINSVIDKFYYDITGPYWDNERKFIDKYYKTIPFPFNEIETPVFYSKVKWTQNHLIGFLKSWSAVQHYIQKNNTNPVDEIVTELKNAWGKPVEKTFIFPVFSRLGVIY